MRTPTEENFLKEVAEHGMQVILDNGLHRHVKFKKPDTYCMQFEIVTWPGYLAYTGDMGSFVFSRIADMFAFFRGKPEGPLQINLGYWAEKCVAKDRSDGIKEYEPEKFREQVAHWLESREATEEIRAEVERRVLSCADEGEHEAVRAAMYFEHDGFRLTDFWEADCREYTHRYIWCCFALAWGIRQYDAAKAPIT